MSKQRIELCCECGDPTGRAGRAEDSMYCKVCGKGPYCEDCFTGDCCPKCQANKEDGGCSCHLKPPCSWCESLSEDEASEYGAGGIEALRKYWAERDNQETSDIQASG